MRLNDSFNFPLKYIVIVFLFCLKKRKVYCYCYYLPLFAGRRGGEGKQFGVLCSVNPYSYIRAKEGREVLNLCMLVTKEGLG